MKKLFFLLFLSLSFLASAQNPGDVAQNYGSFSGFNSTVYSIAVQADGKILVGGTFITYKGVTETRIIRLNADGSKDTGFVTGTGFDGAVYSIVVQADGKILVGGTFTAYKGVTENYLIRLNANGSKDTGFVTGTGFDDIVRSIAVQADGKILVGGRFIAYKGVTEKSFIRLNANGSKDTGFVTGTGFNTSVYSIAVQANGKILVGGFFSTYKGVTANRIIRLNADGSKDTGFTGTGFNNIVYSIVVQADGKILVGGSFTTYNGVTENRIIRLNADGSKDTGFVTGTGFNNIVRSIVVQADGKILVGGDFITYKGVTENFFIRLNADGSKDTGFVTGTGFNNTVYSIAMQADGKIFVGGAFTTYKGTNNSPYLILLHSQVPLSNENFDSKTTFSLYPNPAKDVLHIQLDAFTNMITAKIYDLQGKLIHENSSNTINTSAFPAGLYLIKITTENGELTKKFIKE